MLTNKKLERKRVVAIYGHWTRDVEHHNVSVCFAAAEINELAS